jgi:hypothetical protein
MIDFTRISEYFNFLLPTITAIVGWWGNRAYDRYRKRTEEVGVTGTEHDTVKRISQSSIETIESLNQFTERMVEKTLTQRAEFAAAAEKFEVEIRVKDELISNLRNENADIKSQLRRYKANE